MSSFLHIPVLTKEIVDGLKVSEGGVYVDVTLGTGGHALAIVSAARSCQLIAIDRDEEAIEAARARLQGFNVCFIQEAYSHIKEIVKSLGIGGVNGIVADLGLSSLHLKSKGRGFSFLRDEPLDMRMDRRQGLSAWHIVNKYKEKEISHILWTYGQERHSRKIARAIVSARRKKPVQTCVELAGIIDRCIKRRGKIHPATRSFQALRMQVNREVEELERLLFDGAAILNKEGRFCVIAYHSIEDRIVKQTFRKLSTEGALSIITKKPTTPNITERQVNPSSRSAKLRIAEKI